MKKTRRISKILAIVLTVAMMLSLMPAAAFAEEGSAEIREQVEETEVLAPVEAEETGEPEPAAEEEAELRADADDPDADPEPGVSRISKALKGAIGEEFTVKGVVTMVDGANVYIQDRSGAICLYLAKGVSAPALGDTVLGTGKRADYKGLPELSGASFEPAEGLTLEARPTTVLSLTESDICTYVSIKNLTVTGISGNNTTLQDESGADVLLYKAVTGEQGLNVGDVLDFTGAVGYYNGFQLRNTLAEEITVTQSAGPEEPEYDTIADALAGAKDEEFTVKGVVTLVDGANVYVQDATGGICLYLAKGVTAPALGDTVVGTGKRADYNGLPELSGATYEMDEGLTLEAKETEIGALTAADICTYVSLKGLKVTKVDDNNGKYKTPNIDVEDAAGNSIQLYKAVVEKDGDAWAVKVGDTLDVLAAVGVFKGTLQLRNTLTGEITVQPEQPEEPEEGNVVVLFTNDVHCGIEEGWGYAGLADLKKTLEAEGKTVILVDAGDHVQGGPIGTLSKGLYIVDIMNFVGYDLAIPGNHEFDYGMEQFLEQINAYAEYPYVSANFMNYKDGEPTTPVLDAYKIVEADGLKIAFVGLSTPESITKSTPKYFQDEDGNYIYGFCQDETGAGVVAAAQAAIDGAKAEGADYVIVVGHLGIDEQSSPWTAPEIIGQLSGVDAVIDGHSHTEIDAEIKDKDGKTVLHGQTGTKLANIGKLSVMADGSLSLELLPASEKEKDDPETKEFIDGIKEQYEGLLNTVVSYTGFDLTINDPETGKRAVRSAETNLGDLCADAYRTLLDADIAFVNGGGVRAVIPAGEITFGQILNVHPFGNAACLVEVSGQQILDALEMGSRVVPSENGGFLQVSGLKYEIHSYKEANVTIDESKMWTGAPGTDYRVQNVQVLNKASGEYEPLDLSKTYTLASHNYMLKNQGDGFAMFGTKNVKLLQDEVMLDNQVLINYIQSMPGDGEHEHAVTAEYQDPRGQGRITIVTEKPEEPEEGNVVVLFTNDVHCGIEEGWGYAGLADLKKTLEAEGKTVILVDAGDHVQGGPIGTLSKGLYIVDIMNFVGYDLAIPGNHEFDYGMEQFLEQINAYAEYPYLSANFMNYKDGEPTTPVLDAYKIVEADGLKIAFVGLSTPESITKSTPKYFQDEDGNYIYGFCQDETGAGVVAAAQAAIDGAKAEGADYVIVVGHLGIDEQSSPWTAPEIIGQLSGVDAVIDGHSHTEIDAEIKDKDGKTVLHGQTGTKLANIGKLSVMADGSLSLELLPASEKEKDDPETKEFIDGIKEQYEGLLNTVVSYTGFDLTINDPETGKRAVRSAETNLGDLCADAYRTLLDADIAFVNGGGVRAVIPAGEITFGQILNVHPFGNAACLVEVSGQQILDALEMGSRVVPSENGGFLQVSGLKYEIHSYKEANVTIDENKMWTGAPGTDYRVQNVQVLNKASGEYEPLDLSKTYTLASHNYMLKNQGDGFAMFGTKNVKLLQDEVMLDNQVLINYIQSMPGDGEHEHAVTAEYQDPRGQGRITIVTEKPEEPEKTELDKLTAAPADGAKLVIYHPASGQVMTDAVNGKGLAGTAAEIAEEKLLLTEEMAYLTVHVTEGVYTFELDGKFLTSGPTGNAMSFAEDGSSDLAQWTLEQRDDGKWVLMNVGAAYNGNHNQALEYFREAFTTYGLKETEAYWFELYGVSQGGEEPPQPSGNTYGLTSTLHDGDTVILYNAKSGMGLGNTIANYKITGVALEPKDGVITTDNTDVAWTVTLNRDGTVVFTQGDKTLGGVVSGSHNNLVVTGASYSRWTLTGPDSADFNYFLRLDDMANNYGKTYLEYYKGFTLYGSSDPDKDAFGITFYKKGSEPETPSGEQPGDGPADGDYVIYNAASESVLGGINDMGNALNPVEATITDGKAQVKNGALVFTLKNEGETFTLQTGGKYLASNDDEDLFFQDEADAYAKWYVAKNGDGYIIYNNAAKYKGTPVCIEFFSGFFSGWTFKAADADIFRFSFYPLDEEIQVVDGVAQVPEVIFDCADTRYVGQDYQVKFSLDDLAPEIRDIAAYYVIGETETKAQELSFSDKTGGFTLPAAVLDADGPIESFSLRVEAENSYGITYEGTKTVQVIDEPFIGAVTPAANEQTLDDKQPVISAEIGNAGEDAVFTMTVNGQEVEAKFENGVLSYKPAEPMEDGRVTVTVSVKRSDGKTAEKTWSFTVGKAQFQLYFGQLHSHTTYSDGSGSLESALEYIRNIPESGNVQFVAFTDHSNYFDTTGAANPEGALYDMSLASAASQETWASYKKAVADFNADPANSDLIAIAGFEMTWSGGPGHINTFNTPGIVSRNNSTLNNKTNDAGMKAYYALLDQPEGADSLSQFNHPGKTFGTFSDFAYWDAVTDSRIFLVEVGNGEGQIGSGGYYPSYEEYIKALDKGWHVGPTNNQDNHKGRWGNANDARDVILTDNFSEQGIYDAIRQMRIYATEDKNLEIGYTVNGLQLGSMITEVPEELNFVVTVYDPDGSDSVSKVELVANSGAVAYTWDNAEEIAKGELTATLSPNYSYYFVRVTQADGDLAVTAPVWVGESLKLGISDVNCSVSSPVTGEELTISTTLFNSESTDATVKSVTYTANGSQVLGVNTEAGSVPAGSTATVDFKYTPDKAKMLTITVTAVLELEGTEYTFSKDITLEIKDADKLVYIGIDASHYNEYVSGNYKDSMGNFGALAAEYGVRTVELKTSEELIEACSNSKFVGLIFTAPSRRNGTALRDPYATYSEKELQAIERFNAMGGMVVVTGWGDYYESYASFPAEDHMAAQQNLLLKTLGSRIRLGDDEVVDDELNGGQSMRLYFNTFDMTSPLMEGVIVDPEHPNDREYTEVFSNYGGCSVYFDGDGVPGTVTPVVFGHSGTYTVDSDKDEQNNTRKYKAPNGEERVVVLATESVGKRGLVVVSGAAFMSNFEVQAAVSSGASDADNQKNYANYKVCENLVKGFNHVEITPIADVQAQTETGLIYTIQGVVTSNASGYDKDTAFFDCIYVQDETAGICCFPVAGEFKIGDVVRITGYTDFYQAEMELQVMSMTKIGETEPVEPKEVSSKDINQRTYLGSLVTLKGTVESFEYENGLVQTIMVKDAQGDLARVFIDGYITTGEDVKNLAIGAKITVTGLSSYDDTWKDTGFFARIRVRDRADVLCQQGDVIPGDVNGDGSVDGKDLIILRQYLAGMDVEINLAGADVNGDGTVNGKDLILLRKILAGQP